MGHRTIWCVDFYHSFDWCPTPVDVEAANGLAMRDLFELGLNGESWNFPLIYHLFSIDQADRITFLVVLCFDGLDRLWWGSSNALCFHSISLQSLPCLSSFYPKYCLDLKTLHPSESCFFLWKVAWNRILCKVMLHLCRLHLLL